MRLEIVDIVGKKQAHGFCAPLPPGITLGKIFEHDARLKSIKKTIVQVSINGARADNWSEIEPLANDLIKISVGPQDIITPILIMGSSLAAGVPAGFVLGGIGAVLGPLSTLLGIISVATFFVNLFNQPKSPKASHGSRESPTYGFEGITDTFLPGNPVPVTYGLHRQGGQVLMFYLDVASGSGGRRLIMNEQLALCHGQVSSIAAVEINRLPVTDISSSVTVQVRLGQSSQSVMTGFDRIRNSFADGRLVSSEGIIYKSVGNDIESVDLILSAPALFSPDKEGNLRKQTVGYRLERRTSGSSAWTVVESDKRVVAKTTQQIFFQHSYVMPSRGAYDLRLTHIFHDHIRNKFAAQDISLHAVTEYQDIAGPYSGTALIGIRAVATSQLHGGRPNVTALVYGKLVRIYTSTGSFHTGWTGNPAWCVRDYMTNSVYGMRTPASDIDIQSFIDFATLSDSLCNIC